MSAKRIIGAVILCLILLYGGEYLRNSIIPAKDVTSAQDGPRPSTNKIHESRPSHADHLKINDYGVCSKGDPGISTQWLKNLFGEFLAIFSKRPGSNPGGTKLAHGFALYAMVKHLNPAYIIESGVYRGLGTWILRQAAPEAKLILIDPNDKAISYRDNRNSTVYLTGSQFQDFAEIDWDAMKLDKERTFVFIDDHQSGLRRTLQAWKLGFRHVMYDDNYGPNGDNYSLKTACQVYFDNAHASDYVFKDNFARIKRQLNGNDLVITNYTFDYVTDVYYEFPLPWKSTKTRNVLFEDGIDILKFRYQKVMSQNLWSKEYVNICYVRLAQYKPHGAEIDKMISQLATV